MLSTPEPAGWPALTHRSARLAICGKCLAHPQTIVLSVGRRFALPLSSRDGHSRAVDHWLRSRLLRELAVSRLSACFPLPFGSAWPGTLATVFSHDRPPRLAHQAFDQDRFLPSGVILPKGSANCPKPVAS